MKQQRALLSLGAGSWQQGFESVTLQLWAQDSRTPIQFSGSLPAAPELYQVFQEWRSLYHALYKNYSFWQRSVDPVDRLEEESLEKNSLEENSLEKDGLEIESSGLTQIWSPNLFS